MTTRECSNCLEETAHFNGICAKCNGEPKRKPLEFCCECHISFGSAEKRFAIPKRGNAHNDCFMKWLRTPTQPKHPQVLEVALATQ